MIKFFRKIRYDLMEKNKTGKPASRTGRFFKYAVGEIILVIIGFLLALQVIIELKIESHSRLIKFS